MMSEALSRFPMVWLSCVGLLLFLGVFIGAVLWATRKGSGAIYERMGAIPLEEEGESNHG
jgi:cbb3-type cytochrome oxidase subunit 3